jgi:protein-tyrosine phosphatase
MYKFAPANRYESIVFGAARPKYSEISIKQWIEFMQAEKIEKICCLLETKSLIRYQVDLLAIYRQKFGQEAVFWQPLADFQIPTSSNLIDRIIPFLISAAQNQQKVVVHCAGGVGRTGIVLAAWLVSRRGFTNQQAISAVKQNQRYPQEAIIAALFKLQHPLQANQQLHNLLNDCRNAFN